MSFQKTEKILNRFIDLQSSVWFTLAASIRGQKDVFCMTLRIFSARPPVKVLKTLNGRQSYTLSKFHKMERFQLKILANLHYYMSIYKTEAILNCFIDLQSTVWFTQGSEDETMFSAAQNFFSSTAGEGFQNTKWPAVL